MIAEMLTCELESLNRKTKNTLIQHTSLTVYKTGIRL